jgi:hypothetical protein
MQEEVLLLAVALSCFLPLIQPVLKATLTTDQKLHVRLFYFNEKGTYTILTVCSLVATISTFCRVLSKARFATLRARGMFTVNTDCSLQ